MAEVAKTPSPLAAIFKRQLAAAASEPKSPIRRVPIEVSSDEEGTSGEGAKDTQTAQPPEEGAALVVRAAALPDIDSHSEGERTVRLLVDQRERLKDTDPRGILNLAAAAVQGPCLGVVQHCLPLGDFLWAAGPDSLPRGAWQVLGCVLERKRVADLVGRSASGVHLKQLRRMELSGLHGAFLLIEGDQKHASSCPLYDECEATAAGGADNSGASYAIENQEDIEALCARLFVARSPVGVISTRDIEGTVRLLKNLTCWLQWSSSPSARTAPAAASAVSPPGLTMQAFEAASREHMLAVARAGAGGTCGSLPGEEHRQPAQRSVRVAASPPLFARLHRGCSGAPLPDWVAVERAADAAWAGVDAASWCELSLRDPACAGGAAARVLVGVARGAQLLASVVEAASALPPDAPQAEVADAAAVAFAARLPSCDHSHRLLIFEGLRADMLAQVARVASAPPKVARLAPELLGVVELAALLLDLRCGWRVRVHEARAASSTLRFIQAVAGQLSLGE